MYGYVAHVAIHTLQTDSIWANVATCVQESSRVCTGVHAYPRVYTHFIADFIACDTRVKRMLHACGVELVANLYRMTSNIICVHLL